MVGAALRCSIGAVAAEGHAALRLRAVARRPRGAQRPLPDDVRAILIPALAHGFAIAFAAAAVISAAGFVATFFLKEIPLRTTTRQAPRGAAAD